MTHTALARKYRPTRFADLAGQEHVAAGLKGAVAKERVAHAYLLTGPRGVGKTTAARILAMALNCEARREDGEPCGTCDSCRRIWAGATNLDVVEIDAASNRGVDDARDLRERAMYAASAADHFKIYIIDEAHMLTREAWNALLKILEEPPPRVVFVFATTEPQKIANTAAPVLSRVQRYDFRRIGPQTIVERLRQVIAAEAVEAEDDALVLISRVAAGGMRDALSLLDQALAFGEGRVSAERVRDALGLIADELYAELLGIVADRQPAAVFPFVSRVVDAGADLAEFVNGLGELLRALMIRLLGGAPEGLTGSLRQVVDDHAAGFTSGDVLRMLKLLQETEQAVRRSPNARLHVETLLVQWTLLDRTVDLADVLEALGGSPPPHSAPGGPPPPGNPTRAVGRSGGPPPPGNRAPAVGRSGGRAETERSAGPSVRRSADDQRSAGPPGDLTLDLVRDTWGDILAAVGSKRRILREPLSHVRPLEAGAGQVVLGIAPEAELHLDSLTQGKGPIEEAIGEATGHTVRVSVKVTPPVGEPPSDPSPRRLDPASDKAQRLEAYRQKDQALDAVADVLDLELLE